MNVKSALQYVLAGCFFTIVTSGCRPADESTSFAPNDDEKAEFMQLIEGHWRGDCVANSFMPYFDRDYLSFNIQREMKWSTQSYNNYRCQGAPEKIELIRGIFSVSSISGASQAVLEFHFNEVGEGGYTFLRVNFNVDQDQAEMQVVAARVRIGDSESELARREVEKIPILKFTKVR